MSKIKKNFSVGDLIKWIHLWIHWWFSQKMQIIKMSDVFRKFVNISMDLLIYSIEFVEDFKFIDEFWWIHWRIQMKYWWIQNNLLINSSEFIEES